MIAEPVLFIGAIFLAYAWAITMLSSDGALRQRMPPRIRNAFNATVGIGIAIGAVVWIGPSNIAEFVSSRPDYLVSRPLKVYVWIGVFSGGFSLLAIFNAIDTRYLEPRRLLREDLRQQAVAEADYRRSVIRAQQKESRQREEAIRGEEAWRTEIESQLGRIDDFRRGDIYRCDGEQFLFLLGRTSDPSREFEAFVASMCEERGWATELTGRGTDEGIDVIGRRENAQGSEEVLVAQAKYLSDPNAIIGRPVLSQLVEGGCPFACSS